MHNAGPLPSNRSFGTVLTVFLALVGAYAWWRGTALSGWAFGLSMLTLLVTVARADWLAPLNSAWLRFGHALNVVVNPIILGVLYFGIFAPLAIAMRVAGRDPLKRRLKPEATSYWIDRNPPGPDPAGLSNQF